MSDFTRTLTLGYLLILAIKIKVLCRENDDKPQRSSDDWTVPEVLFELQGFCSMSRNSFVLDIVTNGDRLACSLACDKRIQVPIIFLFWKIRWVNNECFLRATQAMTQSSLIAKPRVSGEVHDVYACWAGAPLLEFDFFENCSSVSE